LSNAASRIEVDPHTIGLHIMAHDGDHLVFTYQRLFSMIWQHQTAPTAVNRAFQYVRDFAESQSPRRFCLLTVIESSATMPSSPARARLAMLMRECSAHVIRSAVGFEGSGFRGAAIRGVATGIAVVSKHQFPHRIFADVEAATEWLADGLTSELGVVKGHELAEVVRVARRLSPS